MKAHWILIVGGIVATMLTSSRGEACDKDGLGQGHPEVIPTAGAVLHTAGTSRIESRLGAGANLGVQFGWQLCVPKLFLGAGLTYTLFAYDDGHLPDAAAAQLGGSAVRWNTNHPSLVDVYGSTRIRLKPHLELSALAGAARSGLIRAHAVVQSGNSSSVSTASLTDDIKSEAGAVIGFGLHYVFRGWENKTEPGGSEADPVPVDAFAVAIGFEPRLYVFGSGSILALPLVISIPIPLN